MSMNLLPAPGHASFTLPHSTLFYISPRQSWTLDDTLDLRRTEAEINQDWANECHWQEWIARQARKFCVTPRVLYGVAPAGAIVQMRLFDRESVA